MKLKLLTILFLFFSCSLFAQLDIKNTSLTRPELNILYVGMDNVIEIVGNDSDTTLELHSVASEVRKISPTQFSVINRNTPDTLRVLKKGKVLFSKFYETKITGNPIAQLGTISDSIATVQEILRNPIIRVIVPHCYYIHKMIVHRFTATLKYKSGEEKLYEDINGYYLSKKIIDSIRQMKSGEKLSLTNIVAYGPDSAGRRLPDITIIVK